VREKRIFTEVSFVASFLPAEVSFVVRHGIAANVCVVYDMIHMNDKALTWKQIRWTQCQVGTSQVLLTLAFHTILYGEHY